MHVDILQNVSFRGGHIMWTEGMDFNYQNAQTWYKNLDKLIRYTNARVCWLICPRLQTIVWSYSPSLLSLDCYCVKYAENWWTTMYFFVILISSKLTDNNYVNQSWRYHKYLNRMITKQHFRMPLSTSHFHIFFSKLMVAKWICYTQHHHATHMLKIRPRSHGLRRRMISFLTLTESMLTGPATLQAELLWKAWSEILTTFYRYFLSIAAVSWLN